MNLNRALLVLGAGLILAGLVAQAQAASRMVVLEEWTNTG
jgi:hypothetical protein